MLEVFTTHDGRPALRGQLDLVAVPSMETFLAELNGSPVAIDMSGVTFFDSCALRTLLAARRLNQHLRVDNPSPAVVKVLEITGTIDYLVQVREIDQ